MYVSYTYRRNTARKWIFKYSPRLKKALKVNFPCTTYSKVIPYFFVCTYCIVQFTNQRLVLLWTAEPDDSLAGPLKPVRPRSRGRDAPQGRGRKDQSKPWVDLKHSSYFSKLTFSHIWSYFECVIISFKDGPGLQPRDERHPATSRAAQGLPQAISMFSHRWKKCI